MNTGFREFVGDKEKIVLLIIVLVVVIVLAMVLLKNCGDGCVVDGLASGRNFSDIVLSNNSIIY